MTYTPADLAADDALVARALRLCTNMGIVIKDWADIKIEYIDPRGVQHELGTMAVDNSSVNIPLTVLARICTLAKDDIERRKKEAGFG